MSQIYCPRPRSTGPNRPVSLAGRVDALIAVIDFALSEYELTKQVH
jgi:hypothetical protein